MIDVGADTLASRGTVSALTVQALKTEARHRADNGRFFGHIAYASILAKRTTEAAAGAAVAQAA